LRLASHTILDLARVMIAGLSVQIDRSFVTNYNTFIFRNRDTV
jgi:hypothetical protein